jgi:hypothetical protein
MIDEYWFIPDIKAEIAERNYIIPLERIKEMVKMYTYIYQYLGCGGGAAMDLTDDFCEELIKIKNNSKYIFEFIYNCNKYIDGMEKLVTREEYLTISGKLGMAFEEETDETTKFKNEIF